MKITFEKDLLVEAMTPAMSAVSDRNTITAIEGILFTTDSEDRVILSSYDLEKGYRTAVKARVERPGSFIINAAKLFRMVRMMPESLVTIEVNEKFQAKISSGNSVFALSALPGGDFPSLPDLNGERGVSIEQSLLKKMIGQVQHAIAVADPRPVFCGAYFRLTPNKVRIVEGSYAHHPALGDYADLKVFSTVEEGEQMARILRRNGERMAEMFRTRWIPMEEKYFSHCGIRDQADIIL